jgi:hypothetical protein
MSEILRIIKVRVRLEVWLALIFVNLDITTYPVILVLDSIHAIHFLLIRI